MKCVVFIIMLSLLGKELCSQMSSGDIALNIRLHPIQSLIVNSIDDQPEVYYKYDSADDEDNVDHISIFSTSCFEVKVGTVANAQSNLYSELIHFLNRNPLQIMSSGLDRSNLLSNLVNAHHLSINDEIVVSINRGGIDHGISMEFIEAQQEAYDLNAGEGRLALNDEVENFIYTVLPK